MSDDQTVWEKEITEAEFGYPNNHFYEDVRYLTVITSELVNIIDDSIGPEAIGDDIRDYLAWYFATKTEGATKDNPSIKLCSCNTKVILNKGCQCGGK
jgi:hypothetical protein